MDVDEAVARLTADPGRTGIFTDFDGTLSPIVDAPEDAVAVDGAAATLTALAARFAVVAVVSGRSLQDLRDRLDVHGVVLAGAYGRERSDRAHGRAATEGWESAALAAAALIRDMDGVVLERKGAGLALHYRAAPHLEAEVRRCAATLAQEFGLDVLPGRRVVELVRPGPRKADAIEAIAAEHDLEAVLIAGDDIADLEAFVWARNSGRPSVVAGVVSEEAPPGLAEASDIVVGGPAELVSFLRRLR